MQPVSLLVGSKAAIQPCWPFHVYILCVFAYGFLARQQNSTMQPCAMSILLQSHSRMPSHRYILSNQRYTHLLHDILFTSHLTALTPWKRLPERAAPAALFYPRFPTFFRRAKTLAFVLIFSGITFVWRNGCKNPSPALVIVCNCFDTIFAWGPAR